ncbi:MAG: hypothetical protein HDKAJFGB_03802 [Anaerolineae bacterium]|nr:hypothetical protein [Anaerolineae bacterium]
MAKIFKWRALSILLAVSAFLGGAALAWAAGMWVTPYSGDYDTAYTVHASGFAPGERVDTWVNKPYQWRVGQGQYTADANGAIEFEFRPDVTWGTGGFFASAQGLSSGREYTASFSIGGGGYPLAPCACSAVLLGSPGGTAVNYNAQGYGSSETVVVYMTDPSAQIHRLPNAQADPWGNLAFPIYLAQDSLYGPYLFTARGLATGRESYNTLTFWGGIQNHRSSNPISFATPVFEIHAGGFTPQENVVIRLTAPSAASRTLTTLQADKDGVVNYSSFVTPGAPFGMYVLSATGVASSQTARASFRWDGVVTPLP